MADENPNPDSKAPADAQADPLAAELMSMGSFGDVARAGNAANAAPPTISAAAPANPEQPNLAELEALLKQASFDEPAGAQPQSQEDLAARLMADAAAAASGRPLPLPSTMPFDLPAFQQAISDSQASSIDLLRDVELNVKIELGRSRMLVEDVLKLSEGAVVELDKLAGDPVDVFVNDRLVARGEVLVLNDNFCVRVNEIVQSVKEEV